MPSLHEDQNGFPTLDLGEPPSVPDLPEHPTPIDLARAYATVVMSIQHQHHKEWSQIVQALHWLYGAFMGVKGGLAEATREIASLRRMNETTVPVIPPMRSELSSSMDLARFVGERVAQDFEAQQNNPSTPPVASMDVQVMVESRVKHEVLKWKAAQLQKAEDERKELEKKAKEKADEALIERRRNKRRLLYVLIPAIITSATSIFVAILAILASRH